MKELLMMLENLSDDINKFFDRFSARTLTPQQIKNRIIIKRKLRKIKRALTPDEIIFPIILGIIVLGAIGFLAIQLG